MNYIILRSICLIVSLFMMQCYVITGAYSKNHRILPVILTCVCLYNFYEVVQAISDSDQVFLLLEQLLLVQSIYIALHYIFDFAGLMIPIKIEILCFFTLLFGNIFTVLQYFSDNKIFRYGYLLFVYGYIIVILISTAIFAITRRIKTKRERRTISILLAAFIFLAIGIPFRRYSTYGVPIFTSYIIVFCIIIISLLRKQYLVDLTRELQDNLFQNNHVATILFDSEKQYLTSNNVAKETFDESYLQSFSHFESHHNSNLLQYETSFYRCFINHVTFYNHANGYIVTATDITDEQKVIHSLSQERDYVEDQWKEKNTYLSLTSHKMRSPLNVIIGISDGLLKDPETPHALRDNLRIIKNSGTTLLSFVEDLLQSLNESLLSKNKEENSFSIDGSEETVALTTTYPNAKILLAEDMLINQKVFKNLVKPWEFQVDVANDGEEAVALAKKNTYQLIFLDKMMPNMNGVEAAKYIQNICDTPLILFTADSTDTIKYDYKAYGFSAYMTKPLELHVIKQIIENLMPKNFEEYASFEDDDIFIPEESQNSVFLLFQQELEGLLPQLQTLYKTDISLFRTKIHGIKSSAKQLDFSSLGEEAEILEMAAKLDNMDYIDSHIEYFEIHCKETIQQIKENYS